MELSSVEAFEGNGLDLQINETLTSLGDKLQGLMEKSKTITQNEFSAASEKITEKMEKIGYAILPIVSKSATFGVDQFYQLGNLVNKTNYSAHDVPARKAIWASDVGLTILVRALRDTKEYLQDINKTAH